MCTSDKLFKLCTYSLFYIQAFKPSGIVAGFRFGLRPRSRCMLLSQRGSSQKQECVLSAVCDDEAERFGEKVKTCSYLHSRISCHSYCTLLNRVCQAQIQGPTGSGVTPRLLCVIICCPQLLLRNQTSAFLRVHIHTFIHTETL